MLGRIACIASGFAAVGWVLVSCGSTTTATSDGPYDAGCPEIITDVHDDIPEPPDGVAACPVGDCNYQDGSGCGVGTACRPQFTAESTDVSPGCEPAGEGELGDACEAGADCAAGFYCAEGVCRRQCCGGDWSACSTGESCIRQVEALAGGEVVETGLSFCYPVNDCDPLDTAPCKSAPKRECKIVDPTGAVACAPISKLKAGDACSPTKACGAGSSCVLDTTDSKNAVFQCRKLCRAEACGEPACAPAEGKCVHFTRDPEGVGECTLRR